MESLLECVFMFFPGTAGWGEFTSAVGIHVPPWKNMVLPCASCPGDCALLRRRLLTPRVQTV